MSPTAQLAYMTLSAVLRLLRQRDVQVPRPAPNFDVNAPAPGMDVNLQDGPAVPTICEAGEDLIVFTSTATSPMLCQAGTAGDGTGTVVVVDYNTISNRGFGWVQAGMLCYDMGCDEPSSGETAWADTGAPRPTTIIIQPQAPKRSAVNVAVGAGPTPAPVPIDANMAGSNMFMSKKPSVKQTGRQVTTPVVRKAPSPIMTGDSATADGGRRLLESTGIDSSSSSWGAPSGSVSRWDATSSSGSISLAPSTPGFMPVSAPNRPVVPQQACRFGICRPTNAQWSRGAAGH